MIDLDKARGHPTLYSSKSAHLAIHQVSPSATEWRLWRRALLIKSDINGKLRQPLGKWLLPLKEQRQRYFAYSFQDKLWIRTTVVDDQAYHEYQRYAMDEGFHLANKVI